MLRFYEALCAGLSSNLLCEDEKWSVKVLTVIFAISVLINKCDVMCVRSSEVLS